MQGPTRGKRKESENTHFGGPLKTIKGPQMNLPRATTNFPVQEYRDITLNTKL